jgi:putative intracellular protease/amidase
MTDTPLNLGALLYEGFEMLDLFGPLEMFSNVGEGVQLAPRRR